MRDKPYYVYILTNDNETVLYIGVTGGLERRVFQHKVKSVSGFKADYGVHRLVHFEVTNDVHAALEREKQLKRWSRAKKECLIGQANPGWKDLSSDFRDD